MKTYKLGTRGSLLAVTQSTLIKNEIEQKSGVKIELVTIKTQGDEITNKPLWQLEGKDFFTKELDEALLKGEVDFVVHSYKDLGSVRPQGIKLAAVTQRKFAHDIFLVTQSTIEKMKNWTGDFIVGTSSPRRIVNLTESLTDFLPFGGEQKPKIKCEMLRGNVNTRIKKLTEGHYHGITLALAGIERLAHTDKSFQELSGLLTGLNYLILPQSIFPSAASQGALGIEISTQRSDELEAILGQLFDEKTHQEVSRERKAFQEYGGGCHLAVGIHVKKISPEHFLHFHRGELNNIKVEKKWIEGGISPSIDSCHSLFVGLPNLKDLGIVGDEYLKKIPLQKVIDLKNQHVFVTSRYTLPALKASSQAEGIWAAGVKSAKEIIKAGYWINGTADSLGVEDLQVIKTSKALKIMHPHLDQNWMTLTHSDSTSSLGEVVGCYTREVCEVSEEFVQKLRLVSACYWTSYPQYQAYLEKFDFLKNKIHFCGLGKTWEEFKQNQIPIHPVAQMSDFLALEDTK